MLFCGACIAEDAIDHAQAKSILSGYLANLEAIEKYDVLILSESHSVSEEGAIEESQSTHRLIWDSSRKRSFGVTHLTKTKVARSRSGAVDQRHAYRWAFAFSNGDGWIRILPQRPNRLLNPTMATAVEMAGVVPNPKLIGLARYPAFKFDEESVEKIYSILRSNARSCSMKSVSANLVDIFSDTQLRDGSVRRVTYRFDADQLKPESFQVAVLVGAPKKPFNQFFERLEFKDHDGLLLPVRVEGEKRQFFEVGEGKRSRGVSCYEASFHWLAVNDSIGDELFDPKLLHDPNALAELVKPPDEQQILVEPSPVTDSGGDNADRPPH